ncbi:hypothetical protein HOY82DRAFT_542801 [Tuber indicum]|nr:hypothetical protein HOY82DRAFT_542801 [Tuber indicum]
MRFRTYQHECAAKLLVPYPTLTYLPKTRLDQVVQGEAARVPPHQPTSETGYHIIIPLKETQVLNTMNEIPCLVHRGGGFRYDTGKAFIELGLPNNSPRKYDIILRNTVRRSASIGGEIVSSRPIKSARPSSNPPSPNADPDLNPRTTLPPAPAPHETLLIIPAVLPGYDGALDDGVQCSAVRYYRTGPFMTHVSGGEFWGEVWMGRGWGGAAEYAQSEESVTTTCDRFQMLDVKRYLVNPKTEPN